MNLRVCCPSCDGVGALETRVVYSAELGREVVPLAGYDCSVCDGWGRCSEERAEAFLADHERECVAALLADAPAPTDADAPVAFVTEADLLAAMPLRRAA